MWLLIFICMLTVVGGVPINQTQEGHATDNVTVTSTLDVPKPVTAEALKVSVIPLNDTQNMTCPATDLVASMLEPQRAGAETFEELQEDTFVQEGDILIPVDRNAVQMLWLDATVPYTISSGLADRVLDILSALKMISDSTCIRFKPHAKEFNYINFLNGKGCASFVGCQGGAQKLFCSASCNTGNICHEIIHALGLHHEHTRKDRDRYITVHWQNIIPGKQKNFKTKRGNTLNLPYDLDSIMHYGAYSFSRDGGQTVLPKRSGEQMGQRTHLSQLDVERLNRLYHCEKRRSL